MNPSTWYEVDALRKHAEKIQSELDAAKRVHDEVVGDMRHLMERAHALDNRLLERDRHVILAGNALARVITVLSGVQTENNDDIEGLAEAAEALVSVP